MNVEIISVGTELLLGDICNTNAMEISKELANMGFNVYHHTVVGDNPIRLCEVLDIAKKRSQIIITTGGLGPTCDDLTKEIIARVFDKELIFNEKAYDDILKYFEKNKLRVTENQRKQALLPNDCTPFYNLCGTAPGCGFISGNTHIIMLPGPPKECMSMLGNSAKDYLCKLSDDVIKSVTLKIFGLGEAYVEEKLKTQMLEYQNPTIAPYAKTNECHVRITAKAKTNEQALEMINPVKNEVYDILGDVIYTDKDKTLCEVVLEKLMSKNISITTAESCTGGLLSKYITDIAGVSSIFKGSICAYSNEIKEKLLGVSNETLEKFGAVSEETAKEMAIGAKDVFDADISVVITGIAGPLGGTKEKPLGLVYVCVLYQGEYYIRKCEGFITREKTREKAVLHALDIIRKLDI